MAVDIQSLLARVVALEKAVLSADAVPFLFWTQGSYPFFVNRVGSVTIEIDSEDFELHTYDVVMRLVIGHVTEGVQGEPETALYGYIPTVIEYFNNRILLIDGSYPTELIGLVRASITDCRGFSVFQQAGVSTQLVGTEFTLRCLYEEEVSQVLN